MIKILKSGQQCYLAAAGRNLNSLVDEVRQAMDYDWVVPENETLGNFAKLLGKRCVHESKNSPCVHDSMLVSGPSEEECIDASKKSKKEIN